MPYVTALHRLYAHVGQYEAVMISIIKDIIAKRNLIRELVLKDLKIRYARPLLGFSWAFLGPLLMVAIFYLVFSLILRVQTQEAPFFLYLMSAVFPWRFFQDSLMSSTTSLVDNKNLIRESRLPHYLIPLSIVFSNAVNFLPSLAILIITSLFILKGIPLFIVFLPMVFILHLLIAAGLSIMFSIVYVKWRDIKYILEAVLLLLFYITPAVYPISLVENVFPKPLFTAYLYNPFVGIVNLYRVTVLKGFYSTMPEYVNLLCLIAIPFCFALVILFSGFSFYKKHKATINDYLSY